MIVKISVCKYYYSECLVWKLASVMLKKKSFTP
jgi:hypothetical protein